MAGNWKAKDLVVGAVVGTVVGAVSALLFAPKSGKELRSDITEQYGKISDKTSDIAHAVGDKTTQIAKTVKDESVALAGKAKQVAVSAVSEVKAWREKKQPEADPVQESDEKTEVPV